MIKFICFVRGLFNPRMKRGLLIEGGKTLYHFTMLTRPDSLSTGRGAPFPGTLPFGVTTSTLLKSDPIAFKVLTELVLARANRH